MANQGNVSAPDKGCPRVIGIVGGERRRHDEDEKNGDSQPAESP